MKTADKKVKEYLERAENIFGDDGHCPEKWGLYSGKSRRGFERYVLKPEFTIEIAKMIQREEND